MALTYAIADIHGRFDLLQKADYAICADFSKAIEHHETPPTIVYTGDLIDRGLESANVISYLMDSRNNQHCKRIVIAGNHEDMMVEIYQKRSDTGLLHWWIGNGGGQTLYSYNREVNGMSLSEIDPVKIIKASHIEWLENLPRAYADEHRVYVHAYIDPTLPISEQSADKMAWTRWPVGTDLPSFEGKHIVHGHEQSKNHPLLLKNRTNLDSFAWYTHRLVIGVFDDGLPGGPIRVLEVLGDKYEG